MEIQTSLEESNLLKSDEEEDFAPKKSTVNNYKSLLDSDSDDENVVSKDIAVEDKNESDDSEGDGEQEKSFKKSRIVSESSESSDSEEEKPETSPEKPAKGRRKNQNPKKKILPVKTQRVSLPREPPLVFHLLP
jgi:hypothetical protein